jgi:hypothetical protein
MPDGEAAQQIQWNGRDAEAAGQPGAAKVNELRLYDFPWSFFSCVHTCLSVLYNHSCGARRERSDHSRVLTGSRFA